MKTRTEHQDILPITYVKEKDTHLEQLYKTTEWLRKEESQSRAKRK